MHSKIKHCMINITISPYAFLPIIILFKIFSYVNIVHLIYYLKMLKKSHPPIKSPQNASIKNKINHKNSASQSSLQFNLYSAPLSIFYHFS